jgi:hypothetical protein
MRHTSFAPSDPLYPVQIQRNLRFWGIEAMTTVKRLTPSGRLLKFERCNTTTSPQSMHRILFLKHWHLFLLMVVPMYWISAEPLRSVINTFGVFVFSGWIYVMGVVGQEKIERKGSGSKPTGLFKLNCILVPLLYVLLVLAFEPIAEGDWAEYIFLPVAVYFCFGVLQMTFFSVKTLTTLEIGRDPKVKDWIFNSILLLFMPVGIWILQPKITSIIGRDAS